MINGLKSKIEQLISRYESLISENADLAEKLFECNKQLEFKNKQIQLQQQQIGNLQLKEAFKNSSDDRHEAKLKVAKLIKEIDKCIGMLNE